MKQVLVTGITGFVGSHLKFYLSNKFYLVGVSRSSNRTLNIKSYDELSFDDLNQSKGIVHLAGKAHDLKNISDKQSYFESNTELTKSVFDSFLESECDVFVFLSSVKAVADQSNTILTEEVKPNPQTAYGKSKLAAEAYILSKEIPSTKRVYILRPCMIHGPGNKGNLNLLYALVKRGIPYPLGFYSNKRSLLSVTNLCFTIQELLINENIPSGVYHVADDDSVSTNEIIEIIGEACKKKFQVLKVPKAIINRIAKIGDVLPFPLNTERLEKLTSNFEVSNAKIKNVMQKELPLTTKEGLITTIQSL